jgi:NADPH:quinone reductase-like Zn-dependent oxidoreductase
MRAVGITRFGGPGVLEIVGRPVPDPGAGEVRIRVAEAHRLLEAGGVRGRLVLTF